MKLHFGSVIFTDIVSLHSTVCFHLPSARVLSQSKDWENIVVAFFVIIEMVILFYCAVSRKVGIFFFFDVHFVMTFFKATKSGRSSSIDSVNERCFIFVMLCVRIRDGND